MDHERTSHAEMLLLREHLAALRTDPPSPVADLRERVREVFGLLPLFPNQFLYIINYTSGEVIHADGFQRVLGYPDHLVDVHLIQDTWHPDDAPLLAHITRRVTHQLTTMRPPLRPFEVTLTVDYRVRKANGEHIKVQRQTSVFHVDERTGRTTSVFSLCRDISDLRTNDRVGWRWEGRGAGRIDFPELRGRVDYRPSARELDVLHRMAQGQSSKLIAEQLAISLHTVNTHRRNLLMRTGATNTAELIRLSTDRGWT